MSLQMHEQSRVPPGFRFHPTDEELVGYYLQKKVACKRIDLDVIREIDLYRMEPWDLQERCRIGTGEQHEWYFFSHKDKKYPTGTRTNRATCAGFWKATGRDKAIFSKYKVIGMRKTLVFYRGRAPNGQKTDWIMHEYRLEEDQCSTATSSNEEGWVVCRVFKKRLIHRRIGENDAACCFEEQIALLPELDQSPDQNLLNDNSTFYTHSFVCKEELDLEDYEPCPYSTAQLPQPGSPESHCDGPRNVGQLILQSNVAAINHPLPLLFEVPELEGQCPKPNVRSDHCSCSQEDAAITQWSVVDRLVAEQLGQDQPCKDLSLRFPTGCNEFQLLGDLLQVSRAAQQPDLSYAEDVDLWSFVK